MSDKREFAHVAKKLKEDKEFFLYTRINLGKFF